MLLVSPGSSTGHVCSTFEYIYENDFDAVSVFKDFFSCVRKLNSMKNKRRKHLSYTSM